MPITNGPPHRSGFYPDGTSGHSGTPASLARAEALDASGQTASTTERVYALVKGNASIGLTDREAQSFTGLGHGTTSGALTRLHRAGRVVRLTEQRHRNEVYVLPEHANGRPESPYRPRPDATALAAENEALRAKVEHLVSSAAEAMAILLPLTHYEAVRRAYEFLGEED